MTGLQIVESKALARRREEVIVVSGRANILQLVPFFVLVKNFSTIPIRLLEKIVDACGAESSTVRERASKPSEPKDGKGEDNAGHKLSDSKKSQERHRDNITKNDKEQFDRDDYEKLVRKTLVFRTNELVYIDSPQLAVSKKKLEMTDSPTNKRLMTRANRPCPVSGVQEPSPTNDKIGVPNKIFNRQGKGCTFWQQERW